MATKESIYFNGMEVRFKLDEHDTNKQMTMFECIIDAGAKMPVPHYHESFDEAIYGIEGVVTYTIDGKETEVGPGDSAFVGRGIVHGFENRTNERIKFLAVITPGIFGPAYFTEIAAVFNAGGAPDMGKIKDILMRHGLVPVMSK
ncbi:cupin domain-containing protein [Flavipsychrobacter stenotrophus]|uniref:Cupin domain-containing protein n=1 Tax=Flavipsychrobacter stenotrophus TaxID=2077091 RepID=A0A2S7SY55_9BACT|nr:cupin domain-containing protein [Flavipsychrobacter stenotrophus]PQJ11852.1 cupin domain-containing protein [Flavipsychrobacter stenotrophus]